MQTISVMAIDNGPVLDDDYKDQADAAPDSQRFIETLLGKSAVGRKYLLEESQILGKQQNSSRNIQLH